MSEKTEYDMRVYYKDSNLDITKEMIDLMSSSDRLKFLIGAGCSHVTDLPLMEGLTTQIVDEVDKVKDNPIMKHVRGIFSGEDSRSIERYMSAIVGYQSVIDKMKQSKIDEPYIIMRSNKDMKGNKKVQAEDLKVQAEDLEGLLDIIKQEILNIIGKKEVCTFHHQNFVKGIHRHLFAGKKNKTVDYFVLNYDTLIEDALGLEEIRYQDGFEGSATGWWNPKLLEEQKDYSRVLKIHGSIDWCLLDEENWTLRRVRSQVKTKKQVPVLIYPNSTKYQEIQRNPFDTLMAIMRSTLSEPKQTVLVICGYSFNDSHINAVIEDAIHVSKGELTVMAFINEDEPTEQLEKWRISSISDQIKIYTNKGVFHGEGRGKGKGPFEWGKFEVLSKLIGGDGR